MSDFKMNLGGVAPARNTSYVSPGEYVARVEAAEVEESNYGNAVRFTWQILDTKSSNADPDAIGARVDGLYTIPDSTMVEKTKSVKGKNKDWSENFVNLMQRKWVSIILAAGLSDPGNVDARKVAKKLVGSKMVILIQDSKRKKPTDPVYSNVNGTMSLPPSDDYEDALEDEDDSVDSVFDVDDMDLDSVDDESVDEDEDSVDSDD